MIAPTARRCKRPVAEMHKFPGEIGRHGIVSGIIIRPNFRQATAHLDCEKRTLRWPGPFGSGFLSPQPPGVVGIGPVRSKVNPRLGPTKVGPFSFWGCIWTALRVVIASAAKQSSFFSDHDWRTEALDCFVASAPRNDGEAARRISSASCRPRRASGRDFRGCRSAHRPPRHRRPRGKYFPAARSSCRHCRSSRRLSADCAPRCSR